MENVSDSNAKNENNENNHQSKRRKKNENNKSKLYKLKEAIFTGKSKNKNVNDHAIFENSLLQNRISSLASEFSKKDGIMEFYKKHKCNTNNK